MKAIFKPIRDHQSDFWTIVRAYEDHRVEITGVTFETHWQAEQMCILLNAVLEEAIQTVEARANQRARFA